MWPKLFCTAGHNRKGNCYPFKLLSSTLPFRNMASERVIKPEPSTSKTPARARRQKMADSDEDATRRGRKRARKDVKPSPSHDDDDEHEAEDVHRQALLRDDSG